MPHQTCDLDIASAVLYCTHNHLYLLAPDNVKVIFFNDNPKQLTIKKEMHFCQFMLSLEIEPMTLVYDVLFELQEQLHYHCHDKTSLLIK